MLDRLWDLNMEGLQFCGPSLAYFLDIWACSPLSNRYNGPFLLPKELSVCCHFSPPFKEVQALSKLCGISCAGFQGNFGST